MMLTHDDLILSAMFSIGLFQFFWLSVVFARKGINPSSIRLFMVPLLGIWVLVWPAYQNTMMPLVSLSLFMIPMLLAWRTQSAFARHLRLCWHTSPEQIRQPSPWIMLILSFIISAFLFSQAPELGLGVGLSFCLAWGAAELLDKQGSGMLLGLSGNPFQTLAGHLVLLLGTSLICAWSLQLYHSIGWQQFIVATLIAGLVASMIRALIAQGWNLPLSMLGMSLTLWLL
ncbi:MAG: hypothetical protein R8M14_04050 [Ghiorsea sp.]